MRKLEKEKGITLISLVITIIILLILAAISIDTLIGENGILTKSKKAKEKNQIEQYKEEVKLVIAEEITERKIQPKEEPFIQSLENKIETKEWVEQTYICNQDGIQESEIQNNNRLNIVSKEGYQIIVEVKNQENQAWILEENKEAEEQSMVNISSNIEELNKLTKLGIKVTTIKTGIKTIKVSLNNQKFYTKNMSGETNWEETFGLEDFLVKEVNFDELNFNEDIQIKITVTKDSGEEINQVKALKNYTVSTASDLKILANEVNSGRNFYKGKTISQVKDIDLQGSSNNPTIAIGKNTNFAFQGIYDGEVGQNPCYRKIKNIYIDSNETYQGLFAYNKGTIRNIGIEEGIIQINEKAVIPTINGTKGGINAGGIAGLNYSNAVIENCYNTASIISKANEKNNNDTGGIAGWNAGIIRNCYNKGEVTNAVGISGGIVGALSSVGDEKGKIEYCYNTATIHGNIAGGLVGVLAIGCHSNFSYTIGNVTGNTKGLFYGVFKGEAYNCFRISYDGVSGSGKVENDAVAIISTGNPKDAIQTESSIKTDTILEWLGGANYWKKDLDNQNNGYHRLSWE